MSNPDFLLFDTDALLQLFVSRLVRLLTHLSDTYAIGAAVVPEVDTEVRFNSRYRDRFEPQLEGELERGRIVIFDAAEARRLLESRGRTPAQIVADAAGMQARAERYHRVVGLGEAYSHATAVELRLPVVSHDINAVRTLTAHGEAVGVPTMRLWDVVALAFDDGVVSVDDVQRAIDALERQNEWVPAFLAKSQELPRHLTEFPSRLRRAPAGTNPVPPTDPGHPLYLRG